MDLMNVEPVVGFRACRILSVVGVLTLSACSGATPTAPTAPPPSPPAPTTYTMSGAITATNGGQPLAGLAVEVGSLSAMTDQAGHYTIALTLGTALLPLRVSGAGVLAHSGYVSPGQSIADFDAIRFDGQFDPVFFREFAHDGFDDGGVAPIARWTQAPNFYIRTIDSQGHAVEPRTIDSTINAIMATTAMWTAGRFGVGTIEQGAGSRLGEFGWSTVTWDADTSDPSCGESSVGDMRGKTMNFYYKKPACSCVGTQISRTIVKHELGHLLGYQHTDNRNDLMFHSQGCAEKMPSAREQYHAAIVYRRPNGNMDPDEDARP